MRRNSSLGLCRKCYDEIIKPENLIPIIHKNSQVSKVREQLNLYEQMFNNQQVQIDELLMKNKTLKQQVEVLSKQPTNMLTCKHKLRRLK